MFTHIISSEVLLTHVVNMFIFVAPEGVSVDLAVNIWIDLRNGQDETRVVYRVPYDGINRRPRRFARIVSSREEVRRTIR